MTKPSEIKFKLESSYKPTGDQPRAIKELTEAIRRGEKHQTFLGVTGSEKHFRFLMLLRILGNLSW